MPNIQIRSMQQEDAPVISAAFQAQGWNKPISQYLKYYAQQLRGERVVLIATYKNEFAGYITLLWQSPDPFFSQHNIPEIQDFNVLIAYRNHGIGSQLMDAIEQIAFEQHPTVGLSVGLLSDYGSAQRLYVKRGYLPTGEGIKYGTRILQYNDQVAVDDDLVLSFIKTR
jgi:ribosomal protein S18 acetylase RimI-like enzyme